MNNDGMGKQILFWAAIIIGIGLVVAGMIWLVSFQNKPKPAPEIVIENAIRPDDWVKGNPTAKVIITEYSDFQCPACALYAPLLEQVVVDFGSDIAFVYRHFPLPSHAYSKVMAYAAEAAGKQGKFWEMHDMIFDNQDKWVLEDDVKNTATNYANLLKLDINRFKTDFDSDEIKQRVESSQKESRDIGLTYTPSIFLNGKLISNPSSYVEFKALITQAINDNQ